MNASRRDLAFLLPAIAAMTANAQAPATARKPMASTFYPTEALAYRSSATKKGRQFLNGVNRSGFGLELHETIMTPGTETHPPHKHAHEEIVIITEGTIEYYVEGKTQRVTAGSVVYIASNEMHNAKNVGDVPSRYYVIELRG